MIDIYPLESKQVITLEIFLKIKIYYLIIGFCLNAIKDYSDKKKYCDWSVYKYIFENNQFQKFDIENYIKEL